MKKNYFLLKATFTFCLLFFQTYVTAQRDVYLVIGQSNAAGRGDIEAEDMVTLTGVDLYNGTSWESAVNTSAADGGLNRYSTVQKAAQDQGLNFAYTLGRTLNEVTGNQIGLVVNARGGSSIKEWEKVSSTGDDWFYQARDEVNAALALGGSTLKGIIWHQGESNRNLGSYSTRLQGLVADFRAEFGMPNLPFIAGQLSMQRTDNETFNANIKKIVDSGETSFYIPDSDYATTDGLVTSDRTHFNSNSQRVLGYRYAAKVLKMVYGDNYIENQIIYIDEDAYVRGGTNANDVQQTGNPEDVIIREDASSADDTQRGLVKFDISSFTGTPNLVIIDVTLVMNAEMTGAVADDMMDVDFYDIASTWSESTVTFNNAPSFSSLISSSSSTYHIDGLYQRGADITEYIKNEYDLGTSTISLGIKSETDGVHQFNFSTKDDAANLALRPYLLVSYIDMSPTLSTETIEENGAPKISFTNPVENELLINSSSNIDEVSLYSLTGQEIKTKKVNNTSVALNVSSLLAGTYVLVIKNKNRITSKLVVKK